MLCVSRRSPALLAMGTLLLACATPTQITIDLSTNALCPSQSGVGDHLESTLIVGAPNLSNAAYDELTITKQCDVGAGDADDNEIGTLVFVPADDNESQQLSLAIFAGVVRPDGMTKMTSEQCRDYFVANKTIDNQPCILARRKLGFVDNTRLILPIELETRCVGVDCGEDQTCSNGTCVDAAVTCDEDGCAPLPNSTTGAGGAGGSATTGGGGSATTGGGGGATGGGGSSTTSTTSMTSSTNSTGGGGSTNSTGGGGSTNSTGGGGSTNSTGGGGSSTNSTTSSTTLTGGGGSPPSPQSNTSVLPITGSVMPSLAGNPFGDEGSGFLGVFAPHPQRSLTLSAPTPLVGRHDATEIVSAAPGTAWDSARVVVATRDGAVGRVSIRGAIEALQSSEQDEAHASQFALLGSVSLRATPNGLDACADATCEPIFLGSSLDFLSTHALTAAALGDGRYVLFVAGDVEGYPMLVRAVLRVTPGAPEIVSVGTVEELGTGGLGDELRDVWVDPRSGALWVVSSEGVFVLDVGEAGF